MNLAQRIGQEIKSIGQEIDSVKDNTYIKQEVDDKLDDLSDLKQDVLVSGTNIKTINGEGVLGNGDITLVTNTTGDVVYSSDSSKYTTPTWIKADGNSYDPEAYPELKDNLGATTLYNSGRITNHIPIIDCEISTLFENIESYVGTNGIRSIFYSNSKEYVIISPEAPAKVMLIFQLDTVDNIYKFKTEYTVSTTNYVSATISNSGKYIAYTSGNNGYLAMWNGTGYGTASSISIAAYQHQLASIADTDLYVTFSCITSGFFKIYYIAPDTTTMTVCTGSMPSVTNGSWCFWLPNSNAIVIHGSSVVEMLSISGTVTTTIQFIPSTQIRSTSFVNADRSYLLVHKTTSPYFEIFKVSGTGFTSIYTEPYNNNAFGALWHENRLLILNSKSVGTFDAVYTIDTNNDTVTKDTTMFNDTIHHVYLNGTGIGDHTSVVYFDSISKILTFKEVSYMYDEVTSKYKFYDFGFGYTNRRISVISNKCYYSKNRDYILIRYRGTTFIAKVVDDLYPVRSTLQLVRKSTLYNNYDHTYFTFHPYIFISTDNTVTNSKYFCIIDPQTGVISEHPAVISFSWDSPATTLISMSEEGNCAVRVYNSASTYLAHGQYLKNGVWTDASSSSSLTYIDRSVTIQDLIKHNNTVMYLSSASTSYLGIKSIMVQSSNNGIFSYYQVGSVIGASTSAGRAIISRDNSTTVYADNHATVNQTWYANRNGVVHTLGIYGRTGNETVIFVSDDGKVIIYGTNPQTVYLWSELHTTYVSAGTTEGFNYYISNYGLSGQLSANLFRANSEYGVAYEFTIMKKRYKVPNILPIRNSAENQVTAYINTGVTQ